MRLVYVPLAEFGGFVLVEAEMNSQRDLVALQRVGEVEIGGRVVGRIATENDQQIDVAGLNVGGKIFERFGLVDWVRVDGVGVKNGFAEITQVDVCFLNCGVQSRRQVVSSDDDTRTLALSRVLNDLQQEVRYLHTSHATGGRSLPYRVLD